MTITTLIVAALTLSLASQFTQAELDAHKAWMDDAQDKKDDVREALAAKDANKLTAAAIEIEKLTDQEQKFWARTDILKAKELAATNRAEAKEMLQAARSAKFDAAGATFARLEKTCSSCHDLHFEKSLQAKP